MDDNVYKDVEFTEKILQDLAETSNKMIRNLKTKGKADEEQARFLDPALSCNKFALQHSKNSQ